MSHPSQYAAIVEAAVRGEFHAAYARRVSDPNAPAAQVAALATRIEGNAPSIKLVEIGNVPIVRRWVGQRQEQALRAAQSMTVYAEEWEANFTVPRTTVEDDQLGLITMRTRELADEAVAHVARQVTLMLAQGNTRPTIDGQPLLSASARGATNANLISTALSTSALQDAIRRMEEFTDDTGEPFGASPDVLLVGPKLRWLARALVESPVVVLDTQGRDYANTLRGVLRVVVSPWLTGPYDDYWFVLDTKREMRAVGYYVKQDNALELQTIFDNDSEYVKLNNRYFVGLRMRHEFFAGAWYTVLGSFV